MIFHFKNMKLYSIVAMSLLAGACSSVAKDTSAHELYSQAMVRQVTHDNRYQFSGKAYLGIESNNGSDMSEKERDAVKKIILNHAGNQEDESESPNDTKMKRIVNKYADRWLGAFALNYTGAVDLPDGKMEVVPELQLKTRLSSASVKLPVLIDMKEGAMYADAEAVTFWADPILEIFDMPAVDGRLLAFKLSADQKKQIPLKNIYKAMPVALKQGYAVLPEKAFSKREMDEFGKKIHAKHLIYSELSGKDYTDMGNTSIQAFRDDLVKQGVQEGMSAEDYQKTIDFLDLIIQQRQQTEPADTSKTTDVAALQQEAARQKMTEWQKILEDSRFLEHWYLDGKGRLLAHRLKWQLPEQVNREFEEMLGDSKKLYVYFDSQIAYTKKPVFTVVPNEKNVFDIGDCIVSKRCEPAK